ncbi:MAG: flavodoxin family protein, partial [ANME-2 cluster archaeon]
MVIFMKIVGINSSPKGENSQTLRLVNAVLDAAKAKGVETELVDLYKYNIQYCKGCFECHRTGTCIHNDDLSQILNKIMESDGLVLGTPVFYSHVGAKIKTLIDRMGDPTHCLFMKEKYGCAVSTSGIFGHEEAIEYLNFFMQFSGGWTLDGIGVPVSAGSETMEEALQWSSILGEDLV